MTANASIVSSTVSVGATPGGRSSRRNLTRTPGKVPRFRLAWRTRPLVRNRVRGLDRVRLHADLTILAQLGRALARVRAVPLAAEASRPFERGWPRNGVPYALKLVASRALRVGGLRAQAGTEMQGQFGHLTPIGGVRTDCARSASTCRPASAFLDPCSSRAYADGSPSGSGSASSAPGSPGASTARTSPGRPLEARRFLEPTSRGAPSSRPSCRQSSRRGCAPALAVSAPTKLVVRLPAAPTRDSQNRIHVGRLD
jgi:hypothetical protein